MSESDGRQLVPGYDLGDRLLTLTDSAAPSTTYAYNALDQLLSESGAAGNLAYTYDDHNRLETRTLSGQSAMTYGYDARDRLSSLTQGAETVGFGYDTADRRTSVTLPNGVTTTASFNNGDQLTALAYTKAGTQLGDFSYSYDTLGQLIGRGGSWDASILPNATSGSATVDANHRLTAFNGQTLSYDVHGNLTGDGVRSYAYDARDQLVEIKQGTMTQATFAYDSFGRRLSKTIDGATTTYRYDGENPIEETTSGATKTILSGLGLDERYARDDSNGRSYFLTDHLGSTVALTDSAGSVTSRYRYEAYGETTQETIQGAASTNPYQYTGRENDGNGLYYYRARYYSQNFKRFTQEDPIGFAAGDADLYAYVGGDPLRYNDPTGECPLCLPLAGALVGGGINLAMQVSTSGWSGVHWNQVGFSAASGLLGGGLGTLSSGLGLAGGLLVDSVGSAAIGGGLAKLNNELYPCEYKDPVQAAIVNGALGGFGSGAARGAAFVWKSVSSAIRSARWHNLPTEIKLGLPGITYAGTAYYSWGPVLGIWVGTVIGNAPL
ncbi:MAG: RHS repeat-associated core domain-containing protein [Dokdonella sp.]